MFLVSYNGGYVCAGFVLNVPAVHAVRRHAYAHHHREPVRARARAALPRHHRVLAQPDHHQRREPLQQDPRVGLPTIF